MPTMYDPTKTIVSQLIIQNIQETHGREHIVLIRFFGVGYKRVQTNYEPILLPDGKVLQVVGCGDNRSSQQYYNLYINSQMIARDQDSEGVDNVVFKKKSVTATSDASSMPSVASQKFRLGMYLIKGGLPQERQEKFQTILADITSRYTSAIISQQYPDDENQQLGVVITDDLLEGPIVFNCLTIETILRKVRYNPFDVQVYDINGTTLQSASGEPSHP